VEGSGASSGRTAWLLGRATSAVARTHGQEGAPLMRVRAVSGATRPARRTSGERRPGDGAGAADEIPTQVRDLTGKSRFKPNIEPIKPKPKLSVPLFLGNRLVATSSKTEILSHRITEPNHRFIPIAQAKNCQPLVRNCHLYQVYMDRFSHISFGCICKSSSLHESTSTMSGLNLLANFNIKKGRGQVGTCVLVCLK
jgi:hypothetical protein